MSQEIELKLSLPPEALPALRRHPLVAAAPRQGRAVTLDNTYFDTPALALRERRVALRTRRHGRSRLQTVKCAATSTGGLSQRPEWEQPFRGTFDFTAIDAPKVRKLLQRHAHDVLPIFTTHFRRETRLYTPNAGVRILMMIDTGEIIAGERREPICELELELEEGCALDLLALARQLAADLPLLPEDLSKAQRGFRLRSGEVAVPQRAEPSGIDVAQAPLDAFRELAFACLRQWQANVVGALDGRDPEFIHQLRVSQRRLRSLVDLFATSLPADFVADWDARLDANAGTFAEARELDVLCDELLPPVVTAGYSRQGAEASAVAALARSLEDARDVARERLRRDLGAAGQGRQLLELAYALHTLPDAPSGDGDLPGFARRQLERLQRKLRRRHTGASPDVPASMHSLRIAVKRLRYAVEFFAPMMPTRRTTAFLKAATSAQDALGFVQDVDVARDWLQEYARDDVEMRLAVAFVSGWFGPRHERSGQRALRRLERMFEASAPWHD